MTWEGAAVGHKTKLQFNATGGHFSVMRSQGLIPNFSDKMTDKGYVDSKFSSIQYLAGPLRFHEQKLHVLLTNSSFLENSAIK